MIDALLGDKRFHIHAGDCLPFLRSLPDACADVAVTDAPYNMKYGYDAYGDDMPDDAYFTWQLDVLSECARVVKDGGSVAWLHYPEWAGRMFWAASEIIPNLHRYELITWVYHTHTGGEPLRKGTRQWCWWGVGGPPVFVGDDARRGEYRNPTDKRIMARIEKGLRPVDNDWWEIEQVKNVSAEKTAHPCQLPLKLTNRLVSLLVPEGGTLLDPFAGSASLGVSAIEQGRRFVGAELSVDYAQIGTERLKALLKEPIQGKLL